MLQVRLDSIKPSVDNKYEENSNRSGNDLQNKARNFVQKKEKKTNYNQIIKPKN